MSATTTLTPEQIAVEWYAKRARCIGGSEIAALFDCQQSYSLSRYALWMVKAGRMPPPDVGGERPKWGTRLEDAIGYGFAQDNGWTLVKGSHQFDKIEPGMGATLDFAIRPSSELAEAGFKGMGVLEAKNVDYIQLRDYWTNDEPPLSVILQCQQEMGVTGFAWGVVCALIGGNRAKQYFYHRDEDTITEIRKRIREFWRSIDENIPPPPDGTEADYRAILRMHPPGESEELANYTLDNELPVLCNEYLKAGSEEREACKRKEAARNRILQRLAGARKAVTLGYRMNVITTPEKPPRPPMPGELIKGRAEVVQLRVKEDVGNV